MRNRAKTKQQLIEELRTLEHRVEELEALDLTHKAVQEKLRRTSRRLAERLGDSDLQLHGGKGHEGYPEILHRERNSQGSSQGNS